MNNYIEALLPENHPSIVQDREIKCVFNSRKMILVGIIDKEERPSTRALCRK